MTSMLFPIRIDASATDGTVRLIDTLLLDATCLPIPPSPPLCLLSSTDDGMMTYDPESVSVLEQTIEQNSIYLAASLLSDMECHGITRVNKTYIGRVKLWDLATVSTAAPPPTATTTATTTTTTSSTTSTSAPPTASMSTAPSSSSGGLYEMILEQIQMQLRIILWIQNWDFIVQKRRQALQEGEEEDGKNKIMRYTQKSEVDPTAEKKNSNDNDTVTLNPASSTILKDDTTKTENEEVSSLPTEPHPQGLLLIKIRLRENNVTISDEFYVDPYLPASNPILLASSIVQDLNLRSEHVNSIAISIAEQMLGLDVEGNVEGFMKPIYNPFSTNPFSTPPPPSSSSLSLSKYYEPVTRDMTAAWAIRNKSKEEATERAHVLKLCRLK